MNWWLILFVALVFSNGLIGFFIGWKAGRKYQQKRIDNAWKKVPWTEITLEEENGIELPLNVDEKENKDEKEN